ncbi:MAG: hypothetical protein IKC22_03435 [Bacilli bacterium]|nr:hypothetical protein [Bacilli bacterium]
MKKIQNLLFIILVLFSLTFIVACGKDDAPEATMVTIDVNPSFEIIVDEEKKVVSITALNDDASVLLYGEVFVGKTIEEVTNTIMNLSVELGYVAEQAEEKIQISVSGATDFKEDLEKEISKTIEKTLEDANIEVVVEKVESMKIDALKEVVKLNSTLSQEEIDAMSEEQLINALKVSRIETQELLNEEMREFYFSMKNYEISFAEKEYTAKIIDELGGLYDFISSTYSSALDAYQNVIQNVEQLKFDLLIDSDSVYQKTLNQVLDAKTKFLEQKKYVATLEAGNVKLEAEIKLDELKTVYDGLIKALENAKASAVSAFDSVISALKKVEETLVSVENMFDANIKETLSAKASELEATLNQAKSEFFTAFEDEYKDDINAYEEMLRAQKEALQK